MHVPKLHWIVVEDSEQQTRIITIFLFRFRVESTGCSTASVWMHFVSPEGTELPLHEAG